MEIKPPILSNEKAICPVIKLQKQTLHPLQKPITMYDMSINHKFKQFIFSLPTAIEHFLTSILWQLLGRKAVIASVSPRKQKGVKMRKNFIGVPQLGSRVS